MLKCRGLKQPFKAEMHHPQHFSAYLKSISYLQFIEEHSYLLYSTESCWGALAYPSSHQGRGRVHRGQFPSPSNDNEGQFPENNKLWNNASIRICCSSQQFQTVYSNKVTDNGKLPSEQTRLALLSIWSYYVLLELSCANEHTKGSPFQKAAVSSV